MFGYASAFNHNIAPWNTDKVKNMIAMFGYASAFNHNITSWNTDKVMTMEWMFKYATSFNHNIAPWNTYKVVTMKSMFYGATAFNHNLCEWLENPKFPNNIYISYMFYGSGCDVTGNYGNPTNSWVCQWCVE